MRSRSRRPTKSTGHIPCYLPSARTSSLSLIDREMELTSLALSLLGLLIPSPSCTLAERGKASVRRHLESIASLPKDFHAAQQDRTFEYEEDKGEKEREAGQFEEKVP